MKYLLQRLLSLIPVAIGVVTISFLLLHMIPGDPVDVLLGDQATALDKQAYRTRLGLDLPLGQQYLNFWSGLLRGELGRSFRNDQPVFDELMARIPATAELALVSMLFAILVAVPLGIFSVSQKRQWIDQLLLTGSWILMSVPSFFIGPMLILVFAVEWDLLPIGERGGIENLILPSVTLGFGLSAILFQTTRAAMIEVLGEDYLRTARAKGLADSKIYFKHAFANALIPVITIVGLQFGAVLTGTVVIETIFDWPGIGLLLFQAIQARDIPVVQAVVLFTSFVYVIVNLVVDVLYAFANPQVRLK